MSDQLTLSAESRDRAGKGASRASVAIQAAFLPLFTAIMKTRRASTSKKSF